MISQSDPTHVKLCRTLMWTNQCVIKHINIQDSIELKSYLITDQPFNMKNQKTVNDCTVLKSFPIYLRSDNIDANFSSESELNEPFMCMLAQSQVMGQKPRQPSPLIIWKNKAKQQQ